LGSILIVTTHANTKSYPTKAWVWWVNSYTWKHFDKKGERALSSFVLHISHFCCHLNSISSLVAIICKLKTCINKTQNKAYTVYPDHFLKGTGNTSVMNKAGLV